MSVSIERFTPEVLERTWGQEVIIAKTSDYLGKVLLYKAGKAGGLQYHREKDETFYLAAGTGWMEYDDGTGTLVKRTMAPKESFRIPPGAPHRFQAITDCVGFEVSTPHFDDRVRVEEQYNVKVISDTYGLKTTGADP